MRIKLHSPKFGPIGLTFLFLLKKGVIREYYNPGKDSKIFNVSASEGRDMLAFT